MQTHMHPIKRNVNGEFPTSHAEAARIFAANRRADGRIASNTFLTEADPIDAYGVTLYATEIVRFYADGRIRLHSGSYQTATTRDRMRQLGVRIYTCQGVAGVMHQGREWTFSDYMELLPNGSVRYTRPTDPDPERVRRHRIRNRRRGEYLACDSRQSSRWHGGNVPEAFDVGEPRHCRKCRANGYVGRIGMDERFCPDCNGGGLIDERLLLQGIVSWIPDSQRYFREAE
jgi:hypothetical protein